MIGFKTIKELSWEECYKILTEDLIPQAIKEHEQHFKKDVEQHFNEEVKNLSLKECYLFLQRNESNTYADKIKIRYDNVLKEWHEREKNDFEKCKTIKEYELFIKKYASYASFYTMLFKTEAEEKIEELYWNECKNTIKGCEDYLKKYPSGKYAKMAYEKLEKFFWKQNHYSISGCIRYLKKYPEGRYVNDAYQKIKVLKRWKLIIGICIFAIFILICFIAYQPARYIIVSLDNIEFSKYGGRETIILSTNANNNNIEILSSSPEVATELEDNTLMVCSKENSLDKRTDSIVIKAYSTFFGNRISYTTKTITVMRESGLPTYLNILPVECSQQQKALQFDKWGNGKSNTSSFTISTDGIAYEIVNHEDVHIRQSAKNKAGTPHEIECSVTLEKNPEGKRMFIVYIKSGKFTQKIYLYQESGLANGIDISPELIEVDKDGTQEGEWYQVDITTDGTYWSAECLWSLSNMLIADTNWVHLYQSNKILQITIDPNKDAVRWVCVRVKSNNGYYKDVTITQDGNPNYLNPSQSKYTFDTDGGFAYIEIDTDSKLPITCEVSHTWLKSSRTGNKIYITCNKNNNDPPKNGIVYVRCGNVEKKITIHQKGGV